MEKDGEEGKRIGRVGMGRYAEEWDGLDGYRKIWAGMGRDERDEREGFRWRGIGRDRTWKGEGGLDV